MPWLTDADSLRHNRLAEVALLVKQSHADHGPAQVAGGLKLITGHVA